MFQSLQVLPVVQSTVTMDRIITEHHVYDVQTTETASYGHLSWTCTVTDQNKNVVVLMDYDIDSREWVAECDNQIFISKMQNPALAAKMLLRDYRAYQADYTV